MKTVTLTISQFVKLFETVMADRQKIHSELHAYQMVFEGLKQAASFGLEPLSADGLDAVLAEAKTSQPLREKMQSAYNEFLETFHRQAAEARTAEEVLEAFDKLTQTRWPN